MMFTLSIRKKEPLKKRLCIKIDTDAYNQCVCVCVIAFFGAVMYKYLMDDRNWTGKGN